MSEERVTCAVCAADITEGQDRYELPCKHVFHTECVMTWFRSCHEAHGSCPTCRHNPTAAGHVKPSYELMKIIVKSARMRSSTPELREAVRRYESATQRRRELRQKAATFKREHQAVLSEYVRTNRKMVELEASERAALRAVCTMHPIIPFMLPVSEE